MALNTSANADPGNLEHDSDRSQPTRNGRVPTVEQRVANAPQGKKRLRLILLRVLISLVLLCLLLRMAGISDVIGVLGASFHHGYLLIVALLLPAVGTLVRALRWQGLLAAQGKRPSLLSLWEGTLVATCYNQLLPSTIGGDVARSWWVSKSHVQGSMGFSWARLHVLDLTVVGVDRLCGLVSIWAVALLAALVSPSVVKEVPAIWAILAVVALGIATATIFPYLSSRVAGRWLFAWKWPRVLRDHAAVIFGALDAYRKHKSCLVRAFLLSMGLQFLIVLQYWALATALGVDISIWTMTVVIPVVMLISMIPVTINGIGLRESSLVMLGAPFGLNASSAVALACAFVAITFVYALLGALVQLRVRRK